MFEIMNTLGDFLGVLCLLPVVFLVGMVLLGVLEAISSISKGKDE